MDSWVQLVIALVGGVFAGGGVAGIISARSDKEHKASAAWAKYSGNLEERIAHLELETEKLPVLTSQVATMATEISELRAENVSLQARVDILTAWNEDYKAWGRVLSTQIIELGGKPRAMHRRRKEDK